MLTREFERFVRNSDNGHLRVVLKGLREYPEGNREKIDHVANALILRDVRYVNRLIDEAVGEIKGERP